LKQIEILYFYPITGNKSGADAPEYVKRVFTGVLERFGGPDVFSDEIMFNGLQEFVSCFDAACQDFARIESDGKIKE
jgi:hypothetical protein